MFLYMATNHSVSEIQFKKSVKSKISVIIKFTVTLFTFSDCRKRRVGGIFIGCGTSQKLYLAHWFSSFFSPSIHINVKTITSPTSHKDQ